MADVIHEVHHDTGSDAGASGVVIGLLIALLIILGFYFFAWPQIRANNADNSGTNINVTLPSNSGDSEDPAGGPAY